MISTGTEALDLRLGRLKRGALYSFLGSATSGKSVLALHFLLDGVARGQHCVLVTNDEPAILESRARYVGAGIELLSENPLLRVLRHRELTGQAGSAPLRTRLEQWLGTRTPELRPARIVLDGIDLLSDYNRTPHAFINELVALLARTDATAYALLRTPISAGGHAGYEPILSQSEGSFYLHATENGERRFEIIRPPDGTLRKDDFQFGLRSGAGFVEELPLQAPSVTPEERQTVIVLDEIGALPEEVLEALQQCYHLVLLQSRTGALSRLSAGKYGALVLTVDPFDDARALDLVSAIRREGSAAPIICAAPTRGLRSTTRSRGLRAGADDFFVTEMVPSEMVERIQHAWQRGTHRRGGFSQIGQFMQPVRQDGSLRPMTRAELVQAVSMLLAEQPRLSFAYLEFRVPAGSAASVWSALRSRLRTGDGDLIGQISDRHYACVLDRATLEQTNRVLERIRAAHQDLAASDEVRILLSPDDAPGMAQRLSVFAENGRVVPDWAAPPTT